MDSLSDSLSVLVQEADAALRGLICDVLAAEGYLVIEAATEQDGLHLVDQRRPDLLLLDMSPPAPARESSVHPLAVDDRHFDVKLVTVSGYAVLTRDAEKTRDAENYTIVGMIQKPFDLDALLAQVTQAAAHCRS